MTFLILLPALKIDYQYIFVAGRRNGNVIQGNGYTEYLRFEKVGSFYTYTPKFLSQLLYEKLIRTPNSEE